MLRGPDEFAQGVLRGGKSLAENTLYGLSDSVGKVSGSLGKGLAELSMDKDYLERRAITSAHASHETTRNLGQGFLRSVEDVSGGFLKVASDTCPMPQPGPEELIS
jgi:vacuolar protein sorting-associated protein 13A/C